MKQKIVIVDIDGTLADSDGIRSPYDEKRVLEDRPYPVVVKWVNNLFPEYKVYIVSGRHDSCRYDTVQWLYENNVEYDKLFMRKANDNRDDRIVKKEILLQILREDNISKLDIAFVIDDRPKVIQMWKQNGLTVYPARGAVDDF